MKIERALVGVVVMAAGALGAVAAGCVSNANPGAASGDSGPGYLPDGAPAPTPTEDGATPTKDSSVPPDSPIVIPSDDAGQVDAAPAPGMVRFAWFVGGQLTDQGGPGGEARRPFAAGPSYDVCVAPHGTGQWVGPLLSQVDAGTSGFAPFTVSIYFPVVAGQYDARIVAAGSGSCNLPPAADAGTVDGGADAGPEDAGTEDAGSVPPATPSTDFTSLPPIAAGAAMTFVLVDPAQPLNTIADVVVLHDATSTPVGKALIRMANVSGLDTTLAEDGGVVMEDSGPVALDGGSIAIGGDFGLGGGAVMSTLLTNVTTAATVAAAANGYVELLPFSGIDGTLATTSSIVDPIPKFMSGYLSTTSLTLPAGGTLTAFYASESSECDDCGDLRHVAVAPPANRAPVLVWCYDGVASPTNPLLTQCSYSDTPTDSDLSGVRFGNFLNDKLDSDQPAVDVCLKAHGYGGYFGPLLSNGQAGLKGGPSGLAYGSISTYFNVHGGYQYDARFVPFGATDCSSSLADETFTGKVGPGGGYTTVALTGYATLPDDAGTIPPYDAGPSDVITEDAGLLEAGTPPPPVSTGLTTLTPGVVVTEDIAYDGNDYAGLRLVHVDVLHPDPMWLYVNQIDGETSSGDVHSRFPFGASLYELDDVPYGGFSTEPGADAYGYIAISGGEELAITIDSSSWDYDPSGNVSTIFAYGTSDGIQLLACDDWDEDFYPDDGTAYDCCTVGSGNCLSGDQGGDVVPMRHVSKAARLDARKYLGR